MTLTDYLGDIARGLRDGREYDQHELALVGLRVAERLQEVYAELEDNPAPEGLEGLDDATLEAANLYAEAAELIMRCNQEGDPSLAEKALECVQEACDTLRLVRQRAGETKTILDEEVGASY
jgi:hypothetical protein